MSEGDDVVYQTLGEDWKGFVALREQNDSGGRFLSKYFRDLME